MKKYTHFQVDAFTDKLFSGNPAGVCPLDNWLPDDLLQNIAMENNLAETAFFVKKGEEFEIRWFTPTIEVDLCGHATLASAYVLFHLLSYSQPLIRFYSSRSGHLTVTREGDLLTLDFPADVYRKIDLTQDILSCFDVRPLEAYKGKTDYMVIFENEEQIRNLIPQLSFISQLNARGMIVTAEGDEVDFVSRFFAPQSGIDEDPVTGSAHTTLTLYWYKRTGRKELSAVQLSPRKGFLKCTYMDDRVKISGRARLYLKGEIEIY